MKINIIPLLLFILSVSLYGQKMYFPVAGANWETLSPKKADINAENL